MKHKQGLWSAKTSGIGLLMEAVICGIHHEWVYLAMSMVVATICIAASFWHRLSFALAPMLMILASWLLYLHIRATSCLIPFLLKAKDDATKGGGEITDSTTCQNLNFGHSSWELTTPSTIIPLIISNILGLLFNLAAIVASTVTIYRAKDKLVLRQFPHNSIRNNTGTKASSSSKSVWRQVGYRDSKQESSDSFSSNNQPNPAIVYVMPAALARTQTTAVLDYRDDNDDDDDDDDDDADKSLSRSETTISLDENLSNDYMLDDGYATSIEMEHRARSTRLQRSRTNNSSRKQHSQKKSEDHPSLKYNIIQFPSQPVPLQMIPGTFTHDSRLVNLPMARVPQLDSTSSLGTKWKKKAIHKSMR